MSGHKYDSLVLELSGYIQKYKELEAIQKDGEFDLKWRLTELFNNVKEEDEQKFIDISGMNNHLLTTSQKKELLKKEKLKASNSESKDCSNDISKLKPINKKTPDLRWAKTLYRRAVRRCHPDTIKISDDDYKEELLVIYKDITEAYENSILDILMVESYKLLIKPNEVNDNQIEILLESKTSYYKKIQDILISQTYAWSTFNDDMKENYLINLMKQQGVRFVDKAKIKSVLKRKITGRKPGQKPENRLKKRVKNNK